MSSEPASVLHDETCGVRHLGLLSFDERSQDALQGLSIAVEVTSAYSALDAFARALHNDAALCVILLLLRILILHPAGYGRLYSNDFFDANASSFDVHHDANFHPLTRPCSLHARCHCSTFAFRPSTAGGPCIQYSRPPPVTTSTVIPCMWQLHQTRETHQHG